MNIFTKVKHPTDSFVIFVVATILTVSGCGVMPTGQRSTRNFTVTGFTLPVAMVYSTGTDVQTRVPGIATSEAGARGFVERLVMQTVLDVLESQGRSALLPDTVISTILRQLTVAVNYAPLMCAKVQLGSTDMTMLEMMESGCIIFGSTVTGICTNTMMGGAAMRCMPPPPPPGGMVIIKPVSGPPLIISGSLSTANIIMANWSRTMWQNIVSRAVRMLASGPFGSHFFSATATVDGN